MSGSKHEHKAGKKYSSSHTTITPTARGVCEAIEAMDEITKISLGFISTGLKVQDLQAVKITKNSTHLLLSVKGNRRLQEIRVYTTDGEAVVKAIKSYCKTNRHELSVVDGIF